MTSPDQPFDWLSRLRQGDDAAFEQLYKLYFRQAAAFVLANSGSEQDARDVFQEALLVLYKKTRDSNFSLKSDPGAYLYAVVRNLWLYRLRSRRTNPEVLTGETATLPDPGVDAFEILHESQLFDERHSAVKRLLETLKPECQKLIEYAYYSQFSTAEIARLLGYAESFIKVKKHRCMEALRKKVNKHPAFNHEL